MSVSKSVLRGNIELVFVSFLFECNHIVAMNL